MQPSSLVIVLPAYNEEARLGPALDELFGYLRRHGERGRDGAPGAAHLLETVRVLVVDDGSTDGTAAIVRARPEALPGGDGQGPASRSCAFRTAAGVLPPRRARWPPTVT